MKRSTYEVVLANWETGEDVVVTVRAFNKEEAEETALKEAATSSELNYFTVKQVTLIRR